MYDTMRYMKKEAYKMRPEGDHSVVLSCFVGWVGGLVGEDWHLI